MDELRHRPCSCRSRRILTRRTSTPSRRATLLAAVLPVLGACTAVGYPAPSPPPAPVAGSTAAGAAGGAAAGSAASVEVRREPLSRYGNPESYEVFGRRYRVMESAEGYEADGIASWYGDEFAGRPTSSGEPYDPEGMTAAHRTLPIPAWVEVVHRETGRRVVVRVNDRGPFADTGRRIIDLSRAAARELDMVGAGLAPVTVRVLAGPLPAGEGK